MQQHRLTIRIQIIVYTLAALAICVLLVDQYRQGFYSLVLSNAIGIPAFLFSAIYIYINRSHLHNLWVHHLLIILLSTLALYQLSNYPEMMVHYLYAIPLFSFFSLPILNAMAINVCVLLAMFSILWNTQDWQESLRYCTNYLLMLGSAWCYAYLTQIKQKSLMRLTLVDPSSGAYNKRYFYHTLEREVSRSQSTQDPMSLIALDINDFDQNIEINGYHAIEVFLQRLVNRAENLVRAGDEIFRLDDSLFILMLPHCPNDGAIVLMERIKRNLEEQNWEPLSELSLTTNTVTLGDKEDAKDVYNRLLTNLSKQQKTNLQIAAFTS